VGCCGLGVLQESIFQNCYAMRTILIAWGITWSCLISMHVTPRTAFVSALWSYILGTFCTYCCSFYENNFQLLLRLQFLDYVIEILKIQRNLSKYALQILCFLSRMHGLFCKLTKALHLRHWTSPVLGKYLRRSSYYPLLYEMIW
jgi:hypothetical protein